MRTREIEISWEIQIEISYQNYSIFYQYVVYLVWNVKSQCFLRDGRRISI